MKVIPESHSPLRRASHRLLTHFQPTVFSPLLFCLGLTLWTTVTGQLVESQDDKDLVRNGVEIKKALQLTELGYQYRMEMRNQTNETMVVDAIVVFSNSETSEAFEDSFSLEPGETTTGSWTTKVRGTQDNALVNLSVKRLRVRTAREVTEERYQQEEREAKERALQAAVEVERRQKVADEWQEQMRQLAAANRPARDASTPMPPSGPIALNPELLRMLLLELDGQKPKPDLSAFPKPVQNHHWGQLIDANLVDGAALKAADGSITSLMLKRLKPAGRVFLSAIRDESVWQKVREEAARETGTLTVKRLHELAAGGGAMAVSR